MSKIKMREEKFENIIDVIKYTDCNHTPNVYYYVSWFYDLITVSVTNKISTQTVTFDFRIY